MNSPSNDSIVTSEGHRIKKKNRFFYRRTGALWTDLYHTPTNRLQFVNYRPDLDEKHQAYVNGQIEKDKRQQLSKYAAKRKSRERQLKRFRQRQVLNQVTSKARGYSELPKTDRWITDSMNAKTVRIKDHRYYNRKGALWTDPALAKTERLHLFIRPNEIERDMWAKRQLEKRRKAEMEVDEAKRARVQKRAQKIREEFRRQVRLNELKRPVTAPLRTLCAARSNDDADDFSDGNICSRERSWTNPGDDSKRKVYAGSGSSAQISPSNASDRISPRPYSSPLNRGAHPTMTDENDVRGHKDRTRPSTTMTSSRYKKYARLSTPKTKSLSMTNELNCSDFSGLLYANSDLAPMLPHLRSGDVIDAAVLTRPWWTQARLDTSAGSFKSSKPFYAQRKCSRDLSRSRRLDARLEKMNMENCERRKAPSYCV